MTVATLPAETTSSAHEESPWRRAWRRLKRRKGAMAALVVVVLLIVLAVLAPWVVPYDPTATSFATVRKPPSWAHWLGTDEVGRDVLSRVIWGARASLSAGLVSVGIAVGAGVPLGLLAGYAGGWIDAVLSRLVDAMLAIPFLILAIALSAFLGPSLSNAMIAIGVTATPVFVRLTRGQTLGAKVEDYVEAARAVGNPHWRIALRHVLPNIVPPLLVQASLAIAGAIIAEAALSFLGLGQQPPAPSWGSMLNAAQRFLTNAPWMAIWPGLAIFLVVLSLNLVGDGLRDALDPRERRLSYLAPLLSAAARQFVGNDRVEIVHRIGLHRGGVLPAEAECVHAAFHFPRGEADFFLDAIRADIAVAHGTLRIASGPAAQFGAAGDYEARRRALARPGEGERIK